MKNLIIWLFTVLMIWMFPARWGANYFFPEIMAQFSGQVPWLMAWGAFMLLISIVAAVLVGDD